MNERIQKLVEQAALAANEDPNGEYPAYMMQKFAELIVRECCDLLQTEDIRHSGYGYNQEFLHKKIKEHFGVKE